MARVLVVRERAGAERTAAVLAELGHRAILLPLHEIRPLDAPVPAGDWTGLVATSASAVPWLARHFGGRAPPAVAVGESTALALERAGFGDVRAGANRASGLPPLLAAIAGGRAGRFLYAAGRVRRPDLEAGCIAAGIGLVTVEVYDAVPRAVTRPEVEAALGRGPPDAVLLLSRGQARAFADLAARCPDLFPASVVPHCLSAAIAEALPAAMRAGAAIAPDGRLDRLLAAIG